MIDEGGTSVDKMPWRSVEQGGSGVHGISSTVPPTGWYKYYYLFFYHYLIQLICLMPRRARGKGLTAKQRREVKNLVKDDEEIKRYDYSVGLTNVDAAGTIFNGVGLPAQGTTSVTRIGNIIKHHAIECNLQIAGNSTDVYNTVRLIFFRWHENDSEDPVSVAKVLNLDGTSPFLSQINWDNVKAKKFTIMKDKTYTLSSLSESFYRNDRWVFRGKRLGQKRQAFQADASQNSNNNCFLLAISDSAVTPYPQLRFLSRLQYADD